MNFFMLIIVRKVYRTKDIGELIEFTSVYPYNIHIDLAKIKSIYKGESRWILKRFCKK